MKDLERVEVRSRAELRRWLLAHHRQNESIWLVTWRKSAGDAHLPADAIVDEALAFGWIDSLPRALDATRTMRMLSPRRAGSGWSKVNKQRIEALVARGQMHAAGLAAIERAKADGSWTWLDTVETLAEPPDLRDALDADAPAARHWQNFPPSVRRAILEWIAQAKTAATRGRRIAQTVAQAHDGIRANQSRQPKSARPPAA